MSLNIELFNKLAAKWKSDSPVGSIFRNMTMLAAGDGVAKVIGMLLMPIVTRIYLPEHMGVLSVFTVIVVMVNPFTMLRFNMAIPLPKNDGLATNLVAICGLLLLTTSTVVFIAFWALAPSILRFLSMEQMLPFWWLLPIAVTGTGLYEVLSSWAVREKAFRALAKTSVIKAAIGPTVKIGLGLLGLKPLGLLIGQVFVQSGGVVSLFCAFQSKISANLRYVSVKRIKFLLMRYADFPKFRLPSQFLLILATKSPLLFYAWHFGAETTGQIGLATAMLMLPMMLFGNTIGHAYYAEIAKIGRKRSDVIFKVTKSITKKLFLISLPPFGILVLWGPWLFEVVFGHNWREAGVFSSILAINLLTMFVTNPITNALNVVGKQAYYLQINIVRTVLIIGVFSVSYAEKFNPEITLLIYSLVLSAHRLVVYARILYIIKKSKQFYEKNST